MVQQRTARSLFFGTKENDSWQRFTALCGPNLLRVYGFFSLPLEDRLYLRPVMTHSGYWKPVVLFFFLFPRPLKQTLDRARAHGAISSSIAAAAIVEGQLNSSHKGR